MIRYDPKEAAEQLTNALQVGETCDAFLMALREQVYARGGIGKLARDTGLCKDWLYDLLSGEACGREPKFSTIAVIVRWLKLEFSFVRDDSKDLSGMGSIR